MAIPGLVCTIYVHLINFVADMKTNALVCLPVTSLCSPSKVLRFSRHIHLFSLTVCDCWISLICIILSSFDVFKHKRWDTKCSLLSVTVPTLLLPSSTPPPPSQSIVELNAFKANASSLYLRWETIGVWLAEVGLSETLSLLCCTFSIFLDITWKHTLTHFFLPVTYYLVHTFILSHVEL